MAATISLTNATAIVLCDTAVDRIDLNTPPGTIKIYSGTAPADADTALGGAVLLGTLTFSNPAFGAAADIAPGARATASAIADDVAADNTGTASFARIAQGGGTNVFQINVGASGGAGFSLEFNTVAFVANALIQITSFTYTQPES